MRSLMAQILNILELGSLFKACHECGWKVLYLSLFILNKSDSRLYLKNLYSHLHWGLLDMNKSLHVAFLLAQANEFESF